jgi:hypothetical protein
LAILVVVTLKVLSERLKVHVFGDGQIRVVKGASFQLPIEPGVLGDTDPEKLMNSSGLLLKSNQVSRAPPTLELTQQRVCRSYVRLPGLGPHNSIFSLPASVTRSDPIACIARIRGGRRRRG